MTKFMTFGSTKSDTFRQLKSGHWVGDTWEGKTFTSVEKFEEGSTGGERFRDIEVREATAEEIKEFIDIVIFNKGKVAIFI